MKKIILLIITFISFVALAGEAEISLGERMFNDIRFSEYFHKISSGNVNFNHQYKKIAFDENEMKDFVGETKSCASCHMVDHAITDRGGSMRGYNDFSVRARVPFRTDGQKLTLRNTPSLIGIGSKFAQNRFSHYDAEFDDHSGTVLGNFTGRNMGWLTSEKEVALKNIVSIIRKDNGDGDLAQEFGGAYERVLLGIDPSIPLEFRISEENRIDVLKAASTEIINKVIFFVSAYMDSLDYEKNNRGVYTGSPYDEFLKINDISPEPKEGQELFDYMNELRVKLYGLYEPKFVRPKRFETHNKEIGFEKLEWEGLKIFFNISETGKRGMCVACHTPPLFTDQLFHNVGVSQLEYDKVHGQGKFNALQVPELAGRGNIKFSARATSLDETATDLGVWNFFARDGRSLLTDYMTMNLCRTPENCSNDFLLPHLIGRMKTPSLRNLGHSGPYLHNGSGKDLGAVLDQYIEAAKLMENRELRNGASQLNRMNFTDEDKVSLEAFMNALNENYE